MVTNLFNDSLRFYRGDFWCNNCCFRAFFNPKTLPASGSLLNFSTDEVSNNITFISTNISPSKVRPNLIRSRTAQN